MATPQKPMLGTTVSHYKILEKIGEGGMGEVFLAEDTKLRRQVCLKFLSTDLTRDETRKQRFIQEARAAAAIQHPHIASVHDIDEVDGRTFIAMEYIPGGSLREAIAGRKLSLRRALELGFQIADGLAKAHEKGVVHRDIKPENVLVSEDGYAKIIDFGLAKLVEPVAEESSSETETKLKTKEGLIMGTVAYMSPEQARGDAIDARSDIFSFGVLLYEMLSGESPFRRPSAVESLSAILKESPAPLTLPGTETPSEMHRILRKAMAKEPGDRYQSMKDLALDLKELREEIGSSVSQPAVAGGARSRPKWLWAVAAAVVLGLVAIGFYLGGRRVPTEAGIGATGRPSIAVMYFEDHTGAEEIRWLSSGLPNMLLTGLAQTPGLDVVSSQRIHEILKQIGQENLASIDKSLVADVARRAGAGAVLVGSIYKAGEEIRIDVQLEDIGSGRILSAESVRGPDVFPLVDELTGRIRTSLNLTDRPAGRSIAEVTTPSLEAYQSYSQGLEAIRNVRFVDARNLFEKAVELDPSFAMAYFELSKILPGVGESARAEEYKKKVQENLDRLPERERLTVEAQWASERGDFERAVETYEGIVAKYPDEGDAWQDLAHIYEAHLNEQEKALDTYERGLKAVPQYGGLRNGYGYYLLWAGRYPEAIRQFETYADLSPGEPNPQDSLAEAYLITGQPERALERYTRVLETDPNFIPSYGGRAWALGIMGRYDEAREQAGALKDYLEGEGVPPTLLYFMSALMASRVGQLRSAKDQLQEGLELTDKVDQDELHFDMEILGAQIAIEERDMAAARNSVSRAREVFHAASDPWVREKGTLLHLMAGAVAARNGDLDAARRELAAQKEIFDERDTVDTWWHYALEGEIAIAAGDPAGAERAFAEGEPELKMFFSNADAALSTLANNLPFRDGRARAKKTQGDLAGAIEIYRGLLTPDIGNKWTAILEPRYVLELARLLDETGQKEAARAEYQRFLALWKDADDGLPELAEAHSYLGL
ncbi:MAG: protein kinase domain-containing protein [Vicinamibacteria bacterium]